MGGGGADPSPFRPPPPPPSWWVRGVAHPNFPFCAAEIPLALRCGGCGGSTPSTPHLPGVVPPPSPPPLLALLSRAATVIAEVPNTSFVFVFAEFCRQPPLPTEAKRPSRPSWPVGCPLGSSDLSGKRVVCQTCRGEDSTGVAPNPRGNCCRPPIFRQKKHQGVNFVVVGCETKRQCGRLKPPL